MSPQHEAMLGLVVAGSITRDGERFYFDGSPVEPLATAVIEDLIRDGFVRIDSGRVEPTVIGSRW